MKTLITALTLTLTTLTSFAQEISAARAIDGAVSTRTRAEVRAELQAAIASGWRPSQGEASHAPEQQTLVSTRTRADVRVEVLAAAARGERLSYGEIIPEPLLSRNAAAMAARGATAVH